MWQRWINALLGLWVVAVPFTGLTGNALAWTLAITGLVIAGLSVWGAPETEDAIDTYRQRRLQH